jgi:hypothetical protein
MHIVISAMEKYKIEVRRKNDEYGKTGETI